MQTQQKRHFTDVSLYLYISRQDSLKKIFRGVPSNQSPSAKGTCWWQICISLWFMVIKIWYSAGKSIESQGWMVICCDGTWEELFYFFFIVFLSICLTQVFINSLLTIKVPVLLKKKNKKTIFPLPTLQEIFTSYLLVSQNMWVFLLCMAFSPSCVIRCHCEYVDRGPSYATDPWAPIHATSHLLPYSYWTGLQSRDWVLWITALELIPNVGSNPLVGTPALLE